VVVGGCFGVTIEDDGVWLLVVVFIHRPNDTLRRAEKPYILVGYFQQTTHF
jgi:hypothetical protein